MGNINSQETKLKLKILSWKFKIVTSEKSVYLIHHENITFYVV